MRRLDLILLAALATGTTLAAQDPQLSVNNFFRVVSTATNPITMRNLPWPPVQPPGYAASPGVVAGTRSWTYTPELRTQAGSQPGQYWTISGMTQAIHVGSAVNTFPAPNHYQFKAGVAPASPGATPPQFVHATTGNDLFVMADQPLMIQQGGIFENSASLATPVPIQKTALLLFAEWRGGEWQDDPMGGQCLGCDWRGGIGPGNVSYSGFTTGINPRTISLSGDPQFRPKIGLLIKEPVLTATGDHAQQDYLPRLANEDYRGLNACYANWSTALNGNLFFDVRAGVNYGANGVAVVLLNIGPTWWPASVPIPPFGIFLLSPADPALSVLSGVPLFLGGAGEYNGSLVPIAVPPLGPTAVGQVLKTQGVVFNPGPSNVLLTTTSAIQIY